MPTLDDLRSTYAHSLAFLTTRNELPLVLNARGLFGCGVEIGVQRALYSAQLLAAWQGSHLISIDPWSEAPSQDYIDIANVAQAEHDRIYDEACRRLAPFGARSTIWRQTSVEAAPRVVLQTNDLRVLLVECLSGRAFSIMPLSALPTQYEGAGLRAHPIIPEHAEDVCLVRLRRETQPALSQAAWQIASQMDLEEILNHLLAKRA